MSDSEDLGALQPDRVFDGGDLDCGSGLVLLIRSEMQQVAVGGVMEMRSREPTVGDDLPPWCRMVGHAYLGTLEGDGYSRYFIRRGAPAENETEDLQKDLESAKAFEWRIRARSTGAQKSRVYCRNFSFDVGQPASFEEKDQHPSAVEYLLGALAGALSTGFASECLRDGLEIDDVEITARGTLSNVLAPLGLEEGDPSFSTIAVKCFASTMDDEKKVRAAWERTVARSPLAATLQKAVRIDWKLAVV